MGLTEFVEGDSHQQEKQVPQDGCFSSFALPALHFVTFLFYLFDIVFKETNVSMQEVNQVFIPLYDFLLAYYGVILYDSTIVKPSMINS